MVYEKELASTNITIVFQLEKNAQKHTRSSPKKMVNSSNHQSKKKIFRGEVLVMKRKIFILLLGVFITLLAVGTPHAEEKSYSLPYANIDLILEEDGNLHVKEQIHFLFKGEFHRVWREIKLNPGEKIENIKVSAKGAYVKPKIDQSKDNVTIYAYLYSDPAKTQPIKDKDVEVTFEYDFLHKIKIYNDVADLDYKIWAENWDVDVEELNANVHLKSKDSVVYWLMPLYYNYVYETGWQDNTLKISGYTFSGEWFKLRMTIPRSQFSENPENGTIINQKGLNQIEIERNRYLEQEKLYQNLSNVISALLLLSLLFPFYIHHKYGKEPEIQYKAEYERDLPTDDPPAVVNAICSTGFLKKKVEPNKNGFIATLMDLIDRKNVILEITASEEKTTLSRTGVRMFKSNSIKLKVDNTRKTWAFENDILCLLKHFERYGSVSLDYIKSEGKSIQSKKILKYYYYAWKDHLKTRFLDEKTLEKFFSINPNVSKNVRIYGFMDLISAFLILLLAKFTFFEFFSVILVGSVSIYCIISPEKIGGSKTVYGAEYIAKWKNFKKYLQDFSLMKEYPPESIEIWNKYLVYAAALGIKKKVKNVMESLVQPELLEESDIYYFHYYGGYYDISKIISDFGGDWDENGGNGGDGGDGGDGGGAD